MLLMKLLRVWSFSILDIETEEDVELCRLQEVCLLYMEIDHTNPVVDKTSLTLRFFPKDIVTNCT